MRETATLLVRELERLRAEDRRREERLTSLATGLTRRLEDLTRRLEEQQRRNDELEAKLDGLNRELTRLPAFERRLDGLVDSLKRL